MLFLTSFFLCFIITRIRSVELQARDACSDNYSKCSPPGASSTGVPAIGPELSSLYTDILSSIQGIKIKERDVQEIGPKLHSRDAPNDFCCKPFKCHLNFLLRHFSNDQDRCGWYKLSITSRPECTILLRMSHYFIKIFWSKSNIRRINLRPTSFSQVVSLAR